VGIGRREFRKHAEVLAVRGSRDSLAPGFEAFAVFLVPLARAPLALGRFGEDFRNVLRHAGLASAGFLGVGAKREGEAGDDEASLAIPHETAALRRRAAAGRYEQDDGQGQPDARRTRINQSFPPTGTEMHQVPLRRAGQSLAQNFHPYN
jgi:hypothetical protein